MMTMLGIVAIVLAYVSGSIPVGYVVARLWGVNVLEIGSGRTGGTNVLRAVGLFPAALTILGDAFKGIIPTYVCVMLFTQLGFPWVAPLAGAAAVLGHNHSLFLKFKGGAGGVTALGSLSALSFYSALAAVVVAIAMISLTRFASMGTFGGAVTGLIMLAIFAWLGWVPTAYILFGVLVVALIGWSLRRNFASIQAGTERKIGASKAAEENQSETA